MMVQKTGSTIKVMAVYMLTWSTGWSDQRQCRPRVCLHSRDPNLQFRPSISPSWSDQGNLMICDDVKNLWQSPPGRAWQGQSWEGREEVLPHPRCKRPNQSGQWWPINPIKLLPKNHTLINCVLLLWPVRHRASRCPVESCFQASPPAFLLQIITFSITWFLVSAAEKYSHAIMVDANMMSPMKTLSTSITKPFSSTWSLDWQVEWATKGTLTLRNILLKAVDAFALVDRGFD